MVEQSSRPRAAAGRGKVPMSTDTSAEARALRLSISGALLLALLGFAFAFWASSSAILLDGAYNLILFTMALLSSKVARLVGRPDDERFPFGYASFEPLLNLTKGLVVGFVVLLAAYGAVDALLHGGRHSEPGLGVVYALLGAGTCTAISLYQRRAFRRTGSPLLEVEAKNWAVDGVICGAVGVGFLAVWLLGRTALAGLVPYADPVIVLVLVVLLAPIPLGIVRLNLGQLLLAAPTPELRAAVLSCVRPLLERPDVVEVIPRLVKVGRLTYLSLSLVIRPDSELGTIAAQDALREALRQALSPAFPGITGDVLFTADRKWVVSPTAAGGPANRAGRSLVGGAEVKP
jgi:cation diffusion facilitator family transporter